MPSKKNMERLITNPLGNKNVGRRTGKDIKAGKNIRKMAGGFENFDDYWSESEADMTREGTFVKPNTPMEAAMKKKGDLSEAPPQPSMSEPPEKPPGFLPSVLVQSQIGNVPVSDALNPLMNKQIGRRTGKDMKAGKTIRMLDNGFENFDDYWSESDAESVASFCTTSSHKSKGEKRSSKSSSNTSVAEKKSKAPKQRSDSGRIKEKLDTDKNGSNQEEAASSIPDQEPCNYSTAASSQAEASSSKDVDSQESNTDSRGVDSQQETHSRGVDSQQETHSRGVDSQLETHSSQGDGGPQAEANSSKNKNSRKTQVVEEEEDEEETHGQSPNNISKAELQRQDQASARKENPTNKKNERKSLGSNHFSELHTDGVSDSDGPSTSVKEKTDSTSEQEDATSSAVAQPNSSAKKQHNKSSSKSNSSGTKESKIMKSGSEAHQSRGKTVHEISSTREVAASERRAVTDSNEESEEEEEGCKDTARKETSSGVAGRKNPSATKNSGCKGKIAEGKKDKPGNSQPASVGGLSGHANQQSTSDQNITGIPQSQTSAAESPPPTSQRSSVYLSVAGDVTGSITRLSKASVLSPEPKLYGTRRRLSYTESPGKEQRLKAKTDTKRSRVPVSKTSSRSVISSPIPEDHKESTEDEEGEAIPALQSQHKEKSCGSSSQCNAGDTNTEVFPQPKSQAKEPVSSLQSDKSEKNKTSQTQLVTKGSLTTKPSSEGLKGNPSHKDVQQHSQGGLEPSQNSISKVGMFVSLVSQNKDRQNTASAGSSASDWDDDDDGFEIVNESKVYRVPTNHPKSIDSRKDRNRAKNVSKRTDSDPPVEKDGNQSSKRDESQPGKTRKTAPKKKIAGRKPFSLSEGDKQQLSTDTQTQTKKRKVTKDMVDEPQSVTAESEDVDMKSQDETSRTERGEKNLSAKKRHRSASKDCQGSSSTDSQEREAVSKKSRKGSKERHRSPSTDSQEREAVSKKSRKGSKERHRSPSTDSQEREAVSKKSRKGSKERHRSPSTDSQEREAVSKKSRKGSKERHRSPSTDSQEREAVSKKSRKGSKERHRSPSTDSQEREVTIKKSKKVAKKKPVDDDVNVSSPAKSKQKSPAVEEKHPRKSLQNSAVACDIDEGDDECLPQTLHSKNAVRNKAVRSRKSNTQNKTGDDICTTENEPLAQKTSAHNKSQSLTRQKSERKIVKSRTHSNTGDEHLVEETAVDSSRTVGRTKKTRSKTRPGKQAAAEDSSVAPEQRKSARRKRPTKVKASMPIPEQQEDSVEPSKRKKRASSSSTHGTSLTRKVRRDSAAVDLQDLEDMTDNEVENVLGTPGGQAMADLSMSDSALKSGISFRRFSHVPSSLKIRRSQQLMHGTPQTAEDDIVSSPALGSASGPGRSLGAGYSVRPAGVLGSTPVSGYLSSRVKGGNTTRRKERRVTISDTVTHHSISPSEKQMDGEETSMMPSMSASPVHYFQQTTPSSAFKVSSNKNKIVPPHANTTGLRRSQRTRVRPIEWYKNERIIYDRRRSGPVVVGIEPSRERLYLEQEHLKRRKRRQMYLVSRKKQSAQGDGKRRLSTHVDVPSNLDMTASTDIPVIHPDTQQEVLMSCFNPAARGAVIGCSGSSPSPGDPFSLKLMTQQNLFTTGILTLAPASEKPLQRTMSTAVLYFITYGKILVTINRATTILQTGDHFFVPRSTVYKLKNLRKEEASLAFANLMVDQEDCDP